MIREVSTSGATVCVYVDSFNKRIRIDDYSGPLEEVLLLIDAQEEPWVQKIILKSRTPDSGFFSACGYQKEAEIKGYFAGGDMDFMVKYPAPARRISEKETKEQEIVESILKSDYPSILPDTRNVKQATQIDAPRLAELYGAIMKVYPTPISDPNYVLQAMKDGTLFVYWEEGGQIVSAASAEINTRHKNAELTDCATLPEAQGKGYMQKLLYTLENKLKDLGFACAYSIARAESYGMNKAFHQLGYQFGGRMNNNCYIYSGLEDMNVWYKLIG